MDERSFHQHFVRVIALTGILCCMCTAVSAWPASTLSSRWFLRCHCCIAVCCAKRPSFATKKLLRRTHHLSCMYCGLVTPLHVGLTSSALPLLMAFVLGSIGMNTQLIGVIIQRVFLSISAIEFNEWFAAALAVSVSICAMQMTKVIEIYREND